MNEEDAAVARRLRAKGGFPSYVSDAELLGLFEGTFTLALCRLAVACSAFVEVLKTDVRRIARLLGRTAR